MSRTLVAGLTGLWFGVGLALSGMMDPARVLGFLDLFGAWDPTLAFVMGSALAVNTPVQWWLKRRGGAPVCAPRYKLPSKTRLDAPLLTGAACFGIGWGLAGYCPGPALASLPQGGLALLGFVLAMIVGMALARAIPLPRHAP